MVAFKDIPAAPPDPIFGVKTKFDACPRPDKYILSVGLYRDEQNKPYVFPSVSKAEDLIIHQHNKDYLPMLGHAPFIEQARKLLWGEEVLAKEGARIGTVQSCAGTGALFMVSRLAKKFLNVPKVLLSNPCWPNYKLIFGENGHELGFYPWAKDGALDLDGCVKGLMEAPEGCLCIFQVCGHNPSGVDPTPEQWKAILGAIDAKKHILCLDFAYMGFGSGDPEEDAKIVREFALSGRQFLVCFSFSKCMGLYGERIGACHVVSGSPEEAKAVCSQMAIFGRMSWSVCPQNGAFIAEKVLSTPELKAQWIDEIKAATARVIGIRNKLCDLLEEKTGKSWEFLRKQRGMFALSGLTPAQVAKLGDSEGVFLPNSGRISVPALNNSNVEQIAQRIANAIKE